MKKYKYEDEEIDLEEKDFLLITAIDNLANQIRKARMQ